MSDSKVGAMSGVLKALDDGVEELRQYQHWPNSTELLADKLESARDAVAEMIERERKAREALVAAVEKADRIGGDMKYSDFTHAGHPNGECAWYIAAKALIAEGVPV